jgi:hypothetical protein
MVRALRSENTRQVLMRAQSVVPSKCIEHTRQELMRTQSIRISFLRVCSLFYCSA